TDVLIFGDRELAGRLPYVVPVPINVGGECSRIDDLPSMLFEQLAIRRLVAGQRQLEGRAALRRQRQEFEEFEMLAPVVRLAFEGDFAPELLPPRNGGESVAVAPPFVATRIEQRGLTRGLECEPLGDGQAAIVVSVVGGPREECDVGFEQRMRFR